MGPLHPTDAAHMHTKGAPCLCILCGSCLHDTMVVSVNEGYGTAAHCCDWPGDCMLCMECMSCCLENVHVSIFVPSIHLSLLLTQWAELYGYGVLGVWSWRVCMSTCKGACRCCQSLWLQQCMNVRRWVSDGLGADTVTTARLHSSTRPLRNNIQQRSTMHMSLHFLQPQSFWRVEQAISCAHMPQNEQQHHHDEALESHWSQFLTSHHLDSTNKIHPFLPVPQGSLAR